MIQAHFPDELEIDSALWTRRAVQALIEQACGVVMPIRTVGLYLWRWGYSPQKPLKRAYEQDPKAVEEWLEQTYPLIEQLQQHFGGFLMGGEHWKSVYSKIIILLSSPKIAPSSVAEETICDCGS